MLMVPSPVPLSRGYLLFAAGLLSLLPAARVRAQLVDASPFLAPGGATGPGSGVEAGTLELRGIMSTPGGTRYCIYDPGKKVGTWVGVSERGNSFMIKSADPAHQAVTVQTEGRTLRLMLREAKVGSLGGPGGPGAAPIAAGPNAGANAGSNAASRPTPADEAARLAQVAEAVRARRQMREQAAQGGTPAAPAAAGARQPGP